MVIKQVLHGLSGSLNELHVSFTLQWDQNLKSCHCYIQSGVYAGDVGYLMALALALGKKANFLQFHSSGKLQNR